MRAVIQRVGRASVTVDGQVVGQIEKGLLVLLGVAKADTGADVDWMATKVLGLRIFEDAAGKMNLDLGQVNGAMLVVSQFTLMADARSGRRPSFVGAKEPVEAEKLYVLFCERVRALGGRVQTGVFRAEMKVELLNDGPVTLILDSTQGPA
jgi:D-tyrosyl-tRNA(Tyr) deacylase